LNQELNSIFLINLQEFPLKHFGWLKKGGMV